jgi:hypothetical protein
MPCPPTIFPARTARGISRSLIADTSSLDAGVHERAPPERRLVSSCVSVSEMQVV